MRRTLILLLATVGLSAFSCSKNRQDDRQAGIYADRIEKSEAISAEEYSEMVSFYCGALERSLDRLKPYHEAHAAALESGDTALIAKTGRELNDKTDRVAADSKNVKRLGSHLFTRMGALPDTTRHRLLNYLSDLYSRYSE